MGRSPCMNSHNRQYPIPLGPLPYKGFHQCLLGLMRIVSAHGVCADVNDGIRLRQLSRQSGHIFDTAPSATGKSRPLLQAHQQVPGDHSILPGDEDAGTACVCMLLHVVGPRC